MKKTYYENLKEITEDELFDGLLGYGFFAEKIPPFLSAESFLDFCKNPPKKFTFENNPKKYINYESMRNINVPRVLAIPHPIAYRNQCQILKDNWDKLLKHFEEKTENSKHKISRIHIRKIDNSSKVFETCYQDMEDIDLNDYPTLIANHLFEMSHQNFFTDDYPQPELMIGKRYIVKADISNCFPSIYSHSIPWALVGKSFAKSKTKDKTEWYDKIDESTRNQKEAETHGILIGPHASNLISEIVLVCVDEVLEKKYSYIRNIDDYECYVETYEKAEEFLIDLASELKKYNLSLNHKKTEILKLPLASTEHWVRRLNTFIFSSDEKLKLVEIRAFLDIALDLMKDNKNNSAILKYAIKVLSNKTMINNAKEYFINTVHHLILLYPYLIPLLDKKVFEPFDISSKEIEKISQNIFKIGKDKKLYEAMSYALYFAIKYDFKFDDDLFKIIDKNRDTVLMLLAYLHDKKFSGSTRFNSTTIGKKYKKLAQSLIDDIDEYWVFIYEILTVGLLESEWGVMKNTNVSFIVDGFLD
ncbi:MAG: RNA-directed DNA polymerase [Sulfurovum sp.]|nr:RNA-directed DNA polymerase [Sulfurovum sp.]